MSHRRHSSSKIAPNFGWFLRIFLGIIIAILIVFTFYPTLAALIPLLSPASGANHGSLAIAWVSGITAFVAVYRLRRPDEAEIPTVRQDIWTTDDQSKDFGLKNFGPGPALYLQLKVVGGNLEDEYFRLEALDHPIHLSEGDSIGLINDPDALASIDEIDEKLDPANEKDLDEDILYFHYSYVSPSGVREPPKVSTKRDDTPVLENFTENDQARKIRIDTVRDYVYDD